MPYYRGDYSFSSYARGDYYRGDIWSTIGGFLKKAAPVAASFIPGVGGLLGKVVGGAILGAGATEAINYGVQKFSGPSVPVAMTHPFPTLGGTGGTLEAPAGRSIMHPFAGGTSFKGQYAGHPNKSTYVTRGGGTSQWPRTLVLHPAGTVAVKRRRMHVTNPRAALRALRRLHGFAKVARKIYRITHPRHTKGGGRFVSRKRR